MEAHLIFSECKSVEDCTAKLNKLLESATVVTGSINGDRVLCGWGNGILPESTHQGLLIDVQPIEREPCKHEPSTVTFYTDISPYSKRIIFDYNSNPKCKHCGIDLVADWRAK